MWTLKVKGIEPIEVLEKISAPFVYRIWPEDPPTDIIVTMYRYKFSTFDDFGCEIFVNESREYFFRYVLYKKDSDEVIYHTPYTTEFFRFYIHQDLARFESKKPRFKTRLWRESLYNSIKEAEKTTRV